MIFRSLSQIKNIILFLICSLGLSIILPTDSFASRKKCEDLATKSDIADPISSMLSRAKRMESEAQQALALEIWQERYSIIAQELNSTNELEFLPISNSIREKLQLLFNSYLRLIVLKIRKLRPSDGIEETDYIGAAYDTMLRSLRSYDPNHKNSISFRNYYFGILHRNLFEFSKIHGARVQFGAMDALTSSRTLKKESNQEHKSQMYRNIFNIASLDAPVQHNSGDSEGTESTLLDFFESAPPSALDLVIQKDEFATTFDLELNTLADSPLLNKARLTEKERRVLELRFSGEGLTLIEVAEVFEVSKERIRQIERHAIRKIKAAIERDHANEF